MEQNGEEWIFVYFTKIDFFCCNQSFRDCPEAPFNWKLFKIGIRSAKDIREDVPTFLVWGSASDPPKLPVFRVVLLHTKPAVQDLCPDTVLDDQIMMIPSRIGFRILYVSS